AFAGADDGQSIFNTLGKNSDVVTKNDVQKNFNKVVGESNGVGNFKPKKVILDSGEVAYESVNGELVRSSKYLKPDGTIKWPEADGFVVDKAGNPIKFDANLKKGQIIDRYGDSGGRFTSPVENGKPLNYDSRGLPYPESSQTYHQYEIVKDINMKTVQEAYDNLPEFDKKLFDKAMDEYDFSIEKMANPQKGKISEVFGSGGGTQFQLGTTVSWYEKLGLLKEIH
ncbi:TNT domain-containing protein, partial [Pseudolactococcus hodotermopsidis]|uniref:TNT domain-containing protein n=1 Tax=Pseudolactococcus hodotermopsidis TaxID=2709157 RepID=UPI001E441BF9